MSMIICKNYDYRLWLIVYFIRLFKMIVKGAV